MGTKTWDTMGVRTLKKKRIRELAKEKGQSANAMLDNIIEVYFNSLDSGISTGDSSELLELTRSIDKKVSTINTKASMLQMYLEIGLPEAHEVMKEKQRKRREAKENNNV